MALGPNDLVTPNVRLLKPIGEGGMGTVWLAHHLALDTEVAVKLLHAESEHEQEALIERFKREAQAAARIKSNHVVQIFDQGVAEGGIPFIVMELLEGESLADRLARCGWLSFRQTGVVVTGVAKALAAAHKVGVVHRDIKPDNIFIVPTDDSIVVKVLDFGIAKQLRPRDGKRLTHDGALIGTPEYMCRDQMLDASAVDAQSDLWSMAIVAYECLTGVLPFDGDTIPAICAKVIEGVFDPPSSVRDNIPPELDAWFGLALARDRDLRFSGAKEMALDFVRRLPTRVDDFEEELERTGEYLMPLRRRSSPPTKVADYSAPPPAIEERKRTRSGEEGDKARTETTLEGTASALPPPPKRRRSARGLFAVVLTLGLAAGGGFYALRAGLVPPSWEARLPLLSEPAPAQQVAEPPPVVEPPVEAAPEATEPVALETAEPPPPEPEEAEDPKAASDDDPGEEDEGDKTESAEAKATADKPRPAAPYRPYPRRPPPKPPSPKTPSTSPEELGF